MKQDEKMMTIADLVRLTGATPMTIYNWRNKRTDKTKLPHVLKRRGERARVFFKPQPTGKWLVKNGVEIRDKALARRFGVPLS